MSNCIQNLREISRRLVILLKLVWADLDKLSRPARVQGETPYYKSFEVKVTQSDPLPVRVDNELCAFAAKPMICRCCRDEIKSER